MGFWKISKLAELIDSVNVDTIGKGESGVRQFRLSEIHSIIPSISVFRFKIIKV
jgi:hypothetical protein